MTLNLQNSIVISKQYSEEYLVGASFDESTLYRVDFQSCRFEGGEKTYSKFVNVNFNDIIFYWMHNQNNIYVSCNFTNVIFGGIKLEDAIFIKCTFTKVLFRPDNIGGGCDLTSVRFVDCEFNEFKSINSKISPKNQLPKEIEVISMNPDDMELL